MAGEMAGIKVGGWVDGIMGVYRMTGGWVDEWAGGRIGRRIGRWVGG